MSDEPVYRLLGLLCLIYGGFILGLMLIPNDLSGRLCFLFVGGTVGSAGTLLYAIANRKRRKEMAPAGARRSPLNLSSIDQ